LSILVNRETRVVVQGITGGEGAFHTAQMKAYGTNIVAGVTPGKGGTFHDGTPVFNTMREAVARTDANASVIFVRADFAADAIMEAGDAGVDLIVCLTEGIPVLDMIVARHYLDLKGVRLIGPNTSGIISP